MLKSFLKYLASILVFVFLSLLVYRTILINEIPAAQKVIPFQVSDDEIPVLKRPGTKSVRIVGPPQTVLKFQLDFKRRPQKLDWNYLQRIDKKTEIFLQGRVETDGNFIIEKLQDRGHPKAGLYIREVLNTWKFYPYKIGAISYYFNVPTRMERMKMQIDLTGLSKNPKYLGPNNLIKNGLLYYVEGIGRKNVMIMN